jgi:stage IV sporulation protein A
MGEETLYEQIGRRTDGNVYLGVVGPVRTGKSTFIKRFMEQLVLPNIENIYSRERAKDELPQSGSGRTIMTSEPKFVPEEAVEICPDGKTKLSVRLIDSVGYMVDGAVGAEEDGKPRLVTTPWLPEEIPLTQAAELGTKKVMEDHSSVGLVMTTDGTITDIPRADYEQAEERAVLDMKATGKPFVVLVNSAEPEGEAAGALCAAIRERYGVSCRVIDCLRMTVSDIQAVLRELLMQFPVTELWYYLPGWVNALEPGHAVRTALFEAMKKSAAEVRTVSEAESALPALEQLEQVKSASVRQRDLGTGIVSCQVVLPEGLFYEVLSGETGFPLASDAALLRLLRELAGVRREYDRVAGALEQVKATGYGVVLPTAEQMKLEPPQIVRKNGSCAVRLHASAPSIHLMRADIETEISPTLGDEKQSEELVRSLLSEYEDDPARLWETNLFGKSLYELVSDGLSAKIARMPEEAARKLRQTLTRILNENTGGLICILL